MVVVVVVVVVVVTGTCLLLDRSHDLVDFKNVIEDKKEHKGSTPALP